MRMTDNVGDAFLTLSKRNEEKTAHLQIKKRRFITYQYDSSPIMHVANPKPHQTLSNFPSYVGISRKTRVREKRSTNVRFRAVKVVWLVFN